MSDVETQGQQDAVCPHCGNACKDTWQHEFDDGDIGEIDCEYCGKPYMVEAFVATWYNSWKPSDQEAG